MKKQSLHHGNTLKTAPSKKTAPSGKTPAGKNAPASRRRYPEMPMIGVGGVVIRGGRALLIRRGSEPLKGEWSIPGGMLEVGETIAEGVARELLEETGLKVSVLDLIEVFERIFRESDSASANAPESNANRAIPAIAASAPPQETSAAGQISASARPLYHFVILDYLCAAPEGQPRAGGDVTDVAFAAENELEKYHLTPTATRVIRRAFEMSRQRSG